MLEVVRGTAVDREVPVLPVPLGMLWPDELVDRVELLYGTELIVISVELS